jgi:uncharacterized protein YjgD (DUF1641 family)
MAEKNKITIEALAIMMQKGLNELSEKLDQKPDRTEIDFKFARKADKSDIERVLARVSMIGGKVDDYNAEQAVTQRQVDKHEKWHHQTAQKIGIKLED